MTIRAPYVKPQTPVQIATAVALTPISLALLVAATVLPFNNSQSVTEVVPVRLTAPDQVHTNINLFTNPIPFAQSQWASGLSLGSLPSPSRIVPYNPNLYATVAAAPFIPAQFSPALSLNSLPTPSRVVPYNQLIYSEVPFYQTDRPQTVAVRYNPPQAQPYNALIYSEVPFVALDWSKPSSATFTHPKHPYNINLYGTVAVASPFAQYDWSKPFQPQLAASQVVPTNINLFTNAVPFALYDWNKPSAYGPSVSPLPQPAIVLSANLGPWTQTDFNKPARYPSVLGAPIPLNASLLTAIPPPPFVPLDWSKPYFPRNQIDATQAANPSSFTNPQPIIPVDTNTVRQNPNFQIWAQQYNVNLFVPPPAPPIVATEPSGKWPGHVGRYKRIWLRKEEEELEQLIVMLKSIPVVAPNTSARVPVVHTEQFRKLLEDYELIRAEPEQPKQISNLVAEATRLIALRQRQIEDDDDSATLLLL